MTPTRYQLTRSPTALDKARPVMSSLFYKATPLPYARQWRETARRLPQGTALIILPTANLPQRRTLEAVATLLEALAIGCYLASRAPQLTSVSRPKAVGHLDQTGDVTECPAWTLSLRRACTNHQAVRSGSEMTAVNRNVLGATFAILLLAGVLAACRSNPSVSSTATLTPTPSPQPPVVQQSPTVIATAPSTPAPTPTVTSAPPSPSPSPSPTATPCPGVYYLSPAIGALAAPLGAAISRWNQWLGCQTFVLDQSATQPNAITVDFAPAEIQDNGWAQFSGGDVWLAPMSSLPPNSTQPYANDYGQLTCVIMHGLGHILGYQDDAASAPLIMKPLSWSSWPPNSCSTPNSP